MVEMKDKRQYEDSWWLVEKAFFGIFGFMIAYIIFTIVS